jgi:hypothetical protein
MIKVDPWLLLQMTQLLLHSVLRAGQSDDQGSIPGGGLGIFLFDTVSRPALGPTQPPIQRVPGALSLGGKADGE